MCCYVASHSIFNNNKTGCILTAFIHLQDERLLYSCLYSIETLWDYIEIKWSTAVEQRGLRKLPMYKMTFHLTACHVGHFKGDTCFESPVFISVLISCHYSVIIVFQEMYTEEYSVLSITYNSSINMASPWCLQVHLRSAERLKDLCCANRGTFIKVGQHLGALDYLLPEEYTSTLKILHSRAPQSSLREIEQVIREDLGKEVRFSLCTHE